MIKKKRRREGKSRKYFYIYKNRDLNVTLLLLQELYLITSTTTTVQCNPKKLGFKRPNINYYLKGVLESDSSLVTNACQLKITEVARCIYTAAVHCFQSRLLGLFATRQAH